MRLTGVLLLISAVGCVCYAEQPAPPSIVLIVVDTWRHDRFVPETGGAMLMPELSRFARDAVVFEQAYSPESWTLPATMSLLTGVAPPVHRVRYNVWSPEKPAGYASATLDALPPEIPTLAEVLQARGYSTAAVQTNPHLLPGSGAGRGFDRYECLIAAAAEQVAARGLALMETMKPPYFLYLHFLDPHAPYIEHPGFAATDAMLRLTNSDIRTMQNILSLMNRAMVEGPGNANFDHLSDTARRYLRLLYDAEIRYTDHHVGRVIDALRAREHPGGICIALTADHGEELWDHGSLGHTRTAYDEVLRVPLAVLAPGSMPARYCEPVQSYDVFPTLALLAGVPPDPRWQGHDLLAAPIDRQIHFEALGPQSAYNIRKRGIRDGDWKLLVDEVSGVLELYDLSRDPGEQENLAQDHPGVVDRLRAAMEARAREDAAHVYTAYPKQQRVLEAETIRSLEALGYL